MPSPVRAYRRPLALAAVALVAILGPTTYPGEPSGAASVPLTSSPTHHPAPTPVLVPAPRITLHTTTDLATSSTGDVTEVTLSRSTTTPDWTIQWPTSTQALLGTPTYAYLTLPPTATAHPYQLQRRTGDTWAPYVTYNAPATTQPLRVRFTIPTDTVETATYRFVNSDANLTSTPYTIQVSRTPAVVGTTPTVLRSTTVASRTVQGAQAVRLSGTVTGAARALDLQVATPRGWMTTATTHATTTGAYALPEPADWYGSHKFRVYAPATTTYAAAATPTATLTVTPGYRPTGRARDWTNLNTGERWNPCQSIAYRVNLHRAPSNGLALVKHAFARVHAATGLRFTYAGSTTVTPYAPHATTAPGTINLGWSTPRTVPSLAGRVIGIGGASYETKTYNNGDTVSRYYAGEVVLDATYNHALKMKFGPGVTEGSLLLHEIGHVIGLGHYSSTTQIMSPVLTPKARGRYGAGDLAGLAHLGASQGCLNLR